MLVKCRICLNLNDHMKHVFEEAPDGKLLISMFKSLTNFEWMDITKIPSYLCSACESSLAASYNFQQLCQESYKILLENLVVKSDDIEVDEGNVQSDYSNCSEAEQEFKVKDNDSVLQSASEVYEGNLQNDYGNCSEAEQEFKVKDNDSVLQSASDSTQCSNVVQNKTNNVITVKKKDVSRIAFYSAVEVRRAINEYKNEQQKHLKCVECDFVSSSIRGLAIHMSLTHKHVSCSWCCVCNKTRINVEEHRLKHKKQKQKCQLCGKHIIKRYFLDHLRRHCNGSENSAPLGNKTKRKSENVHPVVLLKQTQQHIKLPASSISTNCAIKAEVFVCHVCNYKFRNSRRLRFHLSQDHNNKNLYKCSYCDKSHENRSRLIQHERTHTGEKPFICEICGKGFAQSGTKNIHMRQHTGRPEVCEVCEKRFCRPAELRLHMRTHTGEKPFLCTICGKTFIQKSHLSDHMRRHNGQSQYQCHLCEKIFRNKSTLTDHLRQHSGFKRFKCGQCEYSCHKAFRLQQHVKQHNNGLNSLDKIHICLVCQKGFSSQTLLKSHATLTHDVIL